MRTTYLGTSEFAGRVLRRLLDSSHRPSLVVTPPDRPRGRGRKLGSPPAAEEARRLGLELLQAADVNRPEVVERLRAEAPQAVCVCAFGQLIREPLLSEFVMLNVHPSVVPRWRGAAPIERAIMAGDPETGVSIFRVTEGLDSGPVALSARVPIEAGDDYGTLAARLAEAAGELLVDALDRLADDTLEFREQGEDGATYAEKISPQDRRLDPARPAAELERTVRALAPHVGAYLELDGGDRLVVHRAGVVESPRPRPGALAAEEERLFLGCGEGALELLVVQPSGKRTMAAADYLHGHGVPPLPGSG